MALKCTNTSGPPSSCVMKPKPFSPLNHLTVPVAMAIPSFPGLNRPGDQTSHGLAHFEPEGDHPMLPSTATIARGLSRRPRAGARPDSAIPCLLWRLSAATTPPIRTGQVPQSGEDAEERDGTQQ